MLIRSYSQCIHFNEQVQVSKCPISVDEDGNARKWGICNKNCAEGFFPFNSNICWNRFQDESQKVLYYICNIEMYQLISNLYKFLRQTP